MRKSRGWRRRDRPTASWPSHGSTLIGSLPRRLETNVGIATFLQMVEFFNLGMDYDVRVPELLAKVTREDVHAAARAVLDPSKAAVVIAAAVCDEFARFARFELNPAATPSAGLRADAGEMWKTDWPASLLQLKTVRYPRSA